jgi:hypothetical protein
MCPSARLRFVSSFQTAVPRNLFPAVHNSFRRTNLCSGQSSSQGVTEDVTAIAKADFSEENAHLPGFRFY